MKTASRNRLGDISVNLAQLIFRSLEARNIETQTLRDKFGLSNALLASPYSRISIPRYMRLGHQAQSLIDPKRLGLLMAEYAQLNDWGLSGLAASCAPTMGDALATLIRFEHLNSQNCRGASSVSQTGSSNLKTLFKARFYSIKPYNAYNYFVVDSVLACWHKTAQWLSGNQVKPTAVHIEYKKPSDSEQLEVFFGCPVLFDQANNELIYSDEMWHTPNHLRQDNTYNAVQQICVTQLGQIHQNTSQRARVIEALGPLLHGSPPSLNEIAKNLGTTPWTLQRRLAKENCKYSRLLDNTRRELAESYMKDTDFSLAEIAYLLGFSNPASFQRAFKRWLGIAPGQYRDRLRSIEPSMPGYM